MSLVTQGHGPGCEGEAASPFLLFIAKASTRRTASLEALLLLLLCAERITPSLRAGSVNHCGQGSSSGVSWSLEKTQCTVFPPGHAPPPCHALLPRGPSSPETSACGGKGLEEVCFSGMNSLLPLPGIYATFTCPDSQHHQRMSPHPHHKGFRDLCHAQWPGGPCQLLPVSCGSPGSPLSHLLFLW